eukprot:CAMPEP_0116924394 /NCGR_PEP_ID=MMETSP0467-20121206/23481_1 /TAXON_ID=283647 /ORGANISM="Mesodinium pulex, Strain SPMC105" /LENGTH=88 /DNA_ID=CAMNT_0004603207 /DNA_START=1553 /DNA_END=1819 /DNA_ORIENTATION=-
MSAIEKHETIGKLPQQFEGVDSELFENREWKPQNNFEFPGKSRRKNKPPKSTYMTKDEERWLPKRERKKYRKKFRKENADAVQGGGEM